MIENFSNLKKKGFHSALFVMAWGVVLSCGNGGQAPGLHSGQRGTAGTSAIENGKDPLVQSEARPRNPGLRPTNRPVSNTGAGSKDYALEFDFAENLQWAHFRSNGILIDFGTPARNKHTLGDWKSGFRGNYDENGTTFSHVAANRAHIFFDVFPSEAGEGVIAFRGRAEGSHKAIVRLNDKSIGTIEFPRGEFGHAALRVKSGLVSGQNHLSIDCVKRRKVEDGGVSAIALDYVRIVPENSGTGSQAASFDAPRYSDQAGGSDGILLSPNESLTFNMIVVPETRIRGEVRTRQNGSNGGFEVSVARQGKEPKVVFEKGLKERGVSVDIGLGEFEDDIVSVTVRATGSEVVLKHMGMYVPSANNGPAPQKVRAKNIVLVLIDTLRADKLSVYNGRTGVRTPYLDVLGRESMVFKKAMAAENWTKPSVASLLSGLFPETHRTQDDRDRVPNSVVLASQHFQSLGFETAGFVANGYVSGKFGFEKGWDHWVNYVREGKRNRAQFVIDEAISWLETREKDKPFFLYVHTIDPHVPYIPPRKYWSLYDPGPYKGPVKPSGTAQLLEKVKTGKLTLSRRDKIRLEALYDGEISYHDDHLARLHEWLKASGALENTAIIVTSDHGEEFFEHGLVGHGHSLYEELIHVPLILRLPSAEADKGAVSSSEVSLVDVFPTMCDLFQVVCPDGVEGRSLVPLLKGKSFMGWPNASVSCFLSGQRAVRIGRFKAVYRGLGSEVYDLKTDPLETHNIKAENTTVLSGLRDALGNHLGRFVATTYTPQKGTPEKHTKEKAVIDQETKKQLKALGYLGGD